LNALESGQASGFSDHQYIRVLVELSRARLPRPAGEEESLGMWVLLFTIGFVASAVLSWRLITVVVTKDTDENHRSDAIRMFGYLWGYGTIGTGLMSCMVRLFEAGLLR
jgi:hypothetical protein